MTPSEFRRMICEDVFEFAAWCEERKCLIPDIYNDPFMLEQTFIAFRAFIKDRDIPNVAYRNERIETAVLG